MIVYGREDTGDDNSIDAKLFDLKTLLDDFLLNDWSFLRTINM